MRYRIEYAGGKCCNYASGREDLIEWLGLLRDETITDIRKCYQSGITDSVIDKYQKYIVKKAETPMSSIKAEYEGDKKE